MHADACLKQMKDLGSSNEAKLSCLHHGSPCEHAARKQSPKGRSRWSHWQKLRKAGGNLLCIKDAIPANSVPPGSGLASLSGAFNAQAGNLAGQVRIELISRHTIDKRQQIVEAVDVHTPLHKHVVACQEWPCKSWLFNARCECSKRMHGQPSCVCSK